MSVAIGLWISTNHSYDNQKKRKCLICGEQIQARISFSLSLYISNGMSHWLHKQEGYIIFLD